MLKKDGSTVKAGQVLAEWDPYTLPVIAETGGIVNYMDLMEGTSLTETLDDATGLSSKSVTDWKSSAKNSELKPRITLRNEKGEIIKKADGNEARYYLVPDTILSVKETSSGPRMSFISSMFFIRSSDFLNLVSIRLSVVSSSLCCI